MIAVDDPDFENEDKDTLADRARVLPPKTVGERFVAISAAAHQLINQTSGEVEYYTPVEIIEAARRVMRGIYLDPASSAAANEYVFAQRIFTLKDNGLAQRWEGRVWMNHPFGRAETACLVGCTKNHVHHNFDYHGNAKWINKLESEYVAGNVIEACCITFACTSETWFQPLVKRPQCYLTPRTNYRLPDGTVKKGVSKGSVVTYFGNNLDRFAREYAPFGTIKIEYVPSAGRGDSDLK